MEFTREEILKSLKYLDQHPEEFRRRESSTYDLEYEGKKYPPILVLSKANQLRGGSELLLSNFNNSTEKAFKYLTDLNFTIQNKDLVNTNFSTYLKDFLRQSKTDNLGYKKYSINYLNTSVKASFGQGGSANIPWISFLIKPNTTSKGIYPVYLYFKKDNLLILAFGISETNLPNYDWSENIKRKTIGQYYFENKLGKPFRYGESFVHKSYNVENLPADNILEQDLRDIIKIYQDTMENVAKNNLPSNVKQPYFQIDAFNSALSQSNLYFNEKLVKRFVASLITKPFVILTGLAGSGKTKLAQSFIHWVCENDEQYKIIPVGADWINREPLLGYPNGLQPKVYVTPDNGVLDLIITASMIENQNKPYFLVLDEMNLSHVERYFADFLSIMETKDSIKLYSSANRVSTEGNAIPKIISWPNNLFIIGTVNIDETTYMFSPKVLDRANVIEFRLEDTDLKDFLINPKKVDLNHLIGLGTPMASSFLELSKNNETLPNQILNDTLIDFFVQLKKIGAEFGYRSAYEIHLLFTQFSKIDSFLSSEEKIDFGIMQKLLPKLHGSRSKIVKSLEVLMKLCLNDSRNFNMGKLDIVEDNNIKYKLSFDKLKRMYANALSNGFTSYAEA